MDNSVIYGRPCEEHEEDGWSEECQECDKQAQYTVCAACENGVWTQIEQTTKRYSVHFWSSNFMGQSSVHLLAEKVEIEAEGVHKTGCRVCGSENFNITTNASFKAKLSKKGRKFKAKKKDIYVGTRDGRAKVRCAQCQSPYCVEGFFNKDIKINWK